MVKINNKKKIKIVLGFVVFVLAVNVAILGYRNSTKPKNLEAAVQGEYGEEDGSKYFNSINNGICDYIIQYGYSTSSYKLGAPVFSETDIELVCTLDDETQLHVLYNIEKDYCDVSEE